MATIDIGDVAENRSSFQYPDRTSINLGNPANLGGAIDTIEVWAVSAYPLTGFRVGTFYLVSGTTYKCRDSVLIGAVAAGSKQTFNGLAINVVAGDFIGCYYATGRIERDTFGYSGIMTVSGEYIDPGDEASYTENAGDAISLYGTGLTVKTISPSGLSQPLAYGTAKLALSLKPSGLQVPVGYGSLAVQYGKWVYPSGLAVPVGYGTPWVRKSRLLAPTRVQSATRLISNTREEPVTREVPL